ncbi:malonate transporter subunit MadL [Desertibacillus haloalkaliphilus]|uniref:malonate transporter subunit MadL n=1 Tax=Desertibacillus haloalkaliphilus TaxID=1328930 RepID=UPI001C263117|nr:malonate transporter subunit MadL [Desertibacillus haloalkaliphilus]MBU8908289.1 malonate transporter subunit MadL [Desertibacillus haloalkaliphilus]
MVIFGVALLAICLLVGVILGELLGLAIGIDANVGGVGLAMVMLILIVDYLKKRNKLSKPSQEGLGFWSSMYIPIVIAMSANQNVYGALDGGPLAIAAGVAAVIVSWILVPIISRGGNSRFDDEDENIDVEGGETDVRSAN